MLSARRPYKPTRIGVGANGQLDLSSERTWNPVQQRIGELAERLVRVNERLHAERPVDHIRDDADNGQPWVRILRDVEPPPRFPTASWSGQKIRASRSLKMTTARGSTRSASENTRPLFT
jgi:hypothetical protein